MHTRRYGFKEFHYTSGDTSQPLPLFEAEQGRGGAFCESFDLVELSLDIALKRFELCSSLV